MSSRLIDTIITAEKRMTGPLFWAVLVFLFSILISVYLNLLGKKDGELWPSDFSAVEKTLVKDFIGACSVAEHTNAGDRALGTESVVRSMDPRQPQNGGFNSPLRQLLTDATVRVLAEDASGTGFFINHNTIITNRHVIENSQSKILIAHPKWGGKLLEGKLVALTPPKETPSDLDFAVIMVSGDTLGTQSLKLTGLPEPLLPVIAAGFPGIVIDQDKNQIAPETVFSQGIISVLQKQAAGHTLLNHTANIARGNSGGPLTNLCGSVVGVNTFGKTEKENIDGRTLYSLSSVDLEAFLKANRISFSIDSSVCGRG